MYASWFVLYGLCAAIPPLVANENLVTTLLILYLFDYDLFLAVVVVLSGDWLAPVLSLDSSRYFEFGFWF